MISLANLASWMKAPAEHERLEFKEARNQFDAVKLVNYCCALANEGGGHLVLGVTDRLPRRVVGTQAFANLQALKLSLLQKLHLRVEVTELMHPNGRVLVFSVPSRPIAMPLVANDTFWMRAGESLVPMSADHLQRIFAEGAPDFSAVVCPDARLSDLDPRAIERFRILWKKRQPSIGRRAPRQLLADAELLVRGGVTYAALILLGKSRSLSEYLGCSEVIFEYRHEDASYRYAQRVELRDAFLLIEEELWRLVDLRNTVHSFIDGFHRRDIPSINEKAFREAVLNAVCHRDYRSQASTFIRQWPSRVEITSPGGFPPGITVENILTKQFPRNRRLAEAFGRCGLVERAGQGANLLFETALREGKEPLDYRGSDDHQVSLSLHVKVKEEGFLRFLEHSSRDAGRSLSTGELRVLDAIYREQSVPSAELDEVQGLIDLGIIERLGRRRLTVAQKYHRVIGKPGALTRRAGLGRDTNKALLLKHLQRNTAAPLAELCDVLPSLTGEQVRTLLKELRRDGQVFNEGRTRSARWFATNPNP